MRRLTGKMPDFSVYIAAIAAPYLFCALAGMLLGMTFGYAPMIIGAFVGAVAGAVFFSRTPGGAGLKFPSSRFVQYFCAKGLPAVIVVCLFGIAIEVAVLQHFYQP